MSPSAHPNGAVGVIGLAADRGASPFAPSGSHISSQAIFQASYLSSGHRSSLIGSRAPVQTEACIP